MGRRQTDDEHSAQTARGAWSGGVPRLTPTPPDTPPTWATQRAPAALAELEDAVRALRPVVTGPPPASPAALARLAEQLHWFAGHLRAWKDHLTPPEEPPAPAPGGHGERPGPPRPRGALRPCGTAGVQGLRTGLTQPHAVTVRRGACGAQPALTGRLLGGISPDGPVVGFARGRWGRHRRDSFLGRRAARAGRGVGRGVGSWLQSVECTLPHEHG